MTIETGALEQSYAKVESGFNPGSVAALAGSDGIRHLELSLSGKNNREPSPEKRGTPDVQQSLPRRFDAKWNLGQAMWEPSGTTGTPSYLAKFLKAGFGAQTIVATTTTVGGTPTATGGTFASGTGMAVWDLVAFEMPDGTIEATRVLTVNTGSGVATWDTLSAAPDDGATVYRGVTFKPTSSITESLAIYKYYNAGSFKQAVYGAVVDQVQLIFDGTKEVMVGLQGPAADFADSSTGGGTVQAKPGTHVTVGEPIGGMVGQFNVDDQVFLVISAQASFTNAIVLRNKELGTSVASGIAGRGAMRTVQVRITFYLEDTTLIGMAHSVTRGVLRCLVGDTAGSMLAMVVPGVEFEIPEIGNEIGPKEVTIEGIGYATVGNDGIFAAEL